MLLGATRWRRQHSSLPAHECKVARRHQQMLDSEKHFFRMLWVTPSHSQTTLSSLVSQSSAYVCKSTRTAVISKVFAKLFSSRFGVCLKKNMYYCCRFCTERMQCCARSHFTSACSKFSLHRLRGTRCSARLPCSKKVLSLRS